MNQKIVLRTLSKDEAKSVNQIADEIGADREETKQALRKLIDQNRVKIGPRFRYELPSHA